MWVESDTNLPGGEALARQFVPRQALLPRGVRASRPRRSGCPTRSATPARCRRSSRRPGSRWFLTQKISWNKTNKFPHHTFWWEGIDGIAGLHPLPAGRHLQLRAVRRRARPRRRATSARRARPTRSLRAVRLRRRRRRTDPRDARGRADRTADLEGSPRVEIEPPADVLLAPPRPSTPTPPVWSGELYLELHRGTYTSQAETKQGNRRSEHLLREAELWSATASGRAGCDYPYERARPALEDGAAAPVPRHPARHLDRLGAPRGRGDLRSRSRSELEAIIERRADARWPATARHPVAVNAAPHARIGVPALGAAVTDRPDRRPPTRVPSGPGERDRPRQRLDPGRARSART